MDTLLGGKRLDIADEVKATVSNGLSSQETEKSIKVQEVVARKCKIRAIRRVIELLSTELFNKVLSDARRMGTCVVAKQYNALIEPFFELRAEGFSAFRSFILH
ncbi:hypothetical protein Trydic_g4602 [Trypoxylus dichotomus]